MDQYLLQLLQIMKNQMLARGCTVIKIYDGQPKLVYGYKDLKSPYVNKTSMVINKIPDEVIDKLHRILRDSMLSVKGMTFCRLTQSEHGMRIRFTDESLSYHDKFFAINSFEGNLRLNGYLENKEPLEKEPLEKQPLEKAQVPVPVKKIEKEKKKMESFSLSNLKDALVNKITHLDRKTVMILAIIALVLLILGKYQTIKDILIGIKDKVKRSKNFKAMVEDGTNAINGLKKIIGVKDKEAAIES